MRIPVLNRNFKLSSSCFRLVSKCSFLPSSLSESATRWCRVCHFVAPLPCCPLHAAPLTTFSPEDVRPLTRQETLVFDVLKNNLKRVVFQALISRQAEVLDPLRPRDSGRLHRPVLLRRAGRFVYTFRSTRRAPALRFHDSFLSYERSKTPI